MQPLMSTGRAGINVHELQNSDAWRNALAKERADLDRLKDAEYTGTPQARLIRKGEFFGMNYDSVYKNLNIKYKMDTLFKKQIAHFHGTNVSGIIGGNGNNSQNFEELHQKSIFIQILQKYSINYGEAYNWGLCRR